MKTYIKCSHPDHCETETCQDRAVGCDKHCWCCMGELAIPLEEEEVVAAQDALEAEPAHMTKVQIARARAMKREGRRVTDIAQITGLSVSQVNRIANDIPSIVPSGRKPTLTPEDIAGARELRACGWTYQRLANHYKCGIRTMWVATSDIEPNRRLGAKKWKK